MKITSIAAVAAAILPLSVLPAISAPLTYGNFELRFGLNAAAISDDGDVNAYSYLEAFLQWQHQITPDLKFGAKALAAAEYDQALPENRFHALKDPLLDLGVWLEGERFGFLSYSTTETAISEFCVDGASTGDNFMADAFVTVGTCPEFDSRGVLLYKTPAIQGFSLVISHMPDWGIDGVADGEPAESTGAQLLYTGKDGWGGEWSGSLGAERVSRFEDDPRKLTACQAGLNRAQNGWTFGASASVIDNNDGTRDRGYQLGIKRDFDQHLSISLNANTSQLRFGGADLDERSLAVIGLYQVKPGEFMFDGGIWRIHGDDAGVEDDRTVAFVGTSWYF